MSKLKQLVDKAKGLEAKDPKKAVEIWLEALSLQEGEGEPNAALSIYNRIGDLYIKLRDPALAADYYECLISIQKTLGMSDAIGTKEIAAFPDVLVRTGPEVEAELHPEEIWSQLKPLVDSAATRLREMRSAEGARILTELRGALAELREKLATIV